jgi:hypothetical protein
MPDLKKKKVAKFLKQQVPAGSQNIEGSLKVFYFHNFSIAKFG